MSSHLWWKVIFATSSLYYENCIHAESFLRLRVHILLLLLPQKKQSFTYHWNFYQIIAYARFEKGSVYITRSKKYEGGRFK